MKIALIGPTYPYGGGISHFNTLLAKELKKKNEIKVFSYYNRYPSFLYPGKEQTDTKSKIKIEINSERTLSMINPFSWINTALKIRKFNPEKIIFHWVTPFTSVMFSIISIISKIKRKTKTVLICHNITPHEKSSFDKTLSELMFSNTSEFITHSNLDYKILKEKFMQKKIINGFHPAYSFFNFKEFSKTESKKTLKLNKKTILFFGYVREYKGLMNLLEAMPIILKENEVDLVIAGQFWKNKNKYLQKIKELKIEENIKIFDEYIPNEKVGLFFSASDLIIIPYKSPSKSAVIQMAIEFNKPVVVTNKVFGIEKQIQNELNGFIVESRKENIAKAITQFYKEKKEEIFSKNIEKYKKEFTWKKYSELLTS